MRIVKNPLFHTPTSQDELLDQLNRYSDGERVAALTAMGLTWNLLAHLTNPEQKEHEYS